MPSIELTSPRSTLDRARLWDALAASATPLRIWTGDRFLEASWDRCASEAARVAAGLRRRGVEPGACVPCVLTNSYESVLAMLGVWLAGGAVVSLPLRVRGESLADYAAGIERMIESSGGRLLVVDPLLAPALRNVLRIGVHVTSAEELAAPGPFEPAPPAGAELAFVQYSSGSTSAPKGCMLSAQAIVTQIRVLGETLGIAASDRIVSWLPLAHDMGLFGALVMGWMRGAAPTIASPERFLAAPGTWLRDCVEAQATFTVVPNFGLGIAARAARPAGEIPLRGCIIGSDRVELPLLERAAERFGPCGMTYDTLAPAYGLAEATLAVTATAPGDGATAISVDAEALLAGDVHEAAPGVAATTLVACGAPINGVRMRIDGSGDLGEICVRSPSLASGYAGDPARTARTFVDGELRTGDLGFVRDGRLYVTGRTDDMIAVRGRHLHAGELEAQLGRVRGVRNGRCAVVESIRGDRTRLVVVAEPDEHADGLNALASELRDLIARRTGVGVDELRFVRQGSLPRTPSGKVRRFACRALAAKPDSNDLARIVFNGEGSAT